MDNPEPHKGARKARVICLSVGSMEVSDPEAITTIPSWLIEGSGKTAHSLVVPTCALPMGYGREEVHKIIDSFFDAMEVEGRTHHPFGMHDSDVKRAINPYGFRLNDRGQPVCPYCGAASDKCYRMVKALTCWSCHSPMLLKLDKDEPSPTTKEAAGCGNG